MSGHIDAALLIGNLGKIVCTFSGVFFARIGTSKCVRLHLISAACDQNLILVVMSVYFVFVFKSHFPHKNIRQ